MTRCYMDMPEYPDAHKLVSEFFEGDPSKTQTWFEAPNPLLGGISPAEMLALGRGEKLLRCIQDWKAGNLP